MTVSIPRWLLMGLGVVVVFGAGIGAGIALSGGDDSEPDPTTVTVSAESEASEADTTTEADTTSEATTTGDGGGETAALEGKLASCDNGTPLTELIGSVRVTNPGTEPATAAVDFSYVLADGSTIPAEQQTVEVAPGARELALFSTMVSRNESSRFMDHPDWFNSKNCEFEVAAAP